VSFSSSQPCQDPPKKTNLLCRARSHHCHRTCHLRWTLWQRCRPHVIEPVPVLVRVGASALCCRPSWHVSSIASGRYNAGQRAATTRTTLASECFFLFFFFKNLRVADPSSVIYRQCVKRSRQCEYPEMTWHGRGRKRSHSELEESDDYEEDEEDMLSWCALFGGCDIISAP